MDLLKETCKWHDWFLNIHWHWWYTFLFKMWATHEFCLYRGSFSNRCDSFKWRQFFSTLNFVIQMWAFVLAHVGMLVLFCFPDTKSWSHEAPLISSSLDLTWCFLFLMTLSQGCAIHFQVFPSHLCLRNWTVLMNCHFISVKFILTWTFGLLLLLFTGEGDDRGGRWSGRGDGQRIHGWILWAGGFLSFFFTLSFVLYTVLFYLSIHVFHWCNASWIWASSAITAKFQNDIFSIGEYCDVTWILQPNLKLWPSGNLC